MNSLQLRPLLTVLVCGGFIFFLSACDKKPEKAEVPPLDPAAIAEGAMQAYDANSDGSITGDELAKAASVADHPDQSDNKIDKDVDGKISKDEIQARAQFWIDSKVGIQTYRCVVKLDGQPLEGAVVKYIPEPFMGGAVEEASGTTEADGAAVLAIDDAKLPAHLKGIKGMRSGFYKVEITHPTKKIPAKYNTETTLGQEVSKATSRLHVVHELKGR